MGVHEKASFLTPAILDRIEELLDEGNYEKTVYQLMEINPCTWEYWKREAGKIQAQIDEGNLKYSSLKMGDKRILRLLKICKKGRAKAIQKALTNINRAGMDPAHWQANAWYLERVEPEFFGRKQRVEHSGPGGGPIVHTELSEEDKKRFLSNFGEFFPDLVDDDG